MTGLPTPPNGSNDGITIAKVVQVLPLIVVIVTMAVGWQEVKGQLEAERNYRMQYQADSKEQMTVLNGIYDKLENRTRDLEQSNARADERFNLILTLMTEMKTQIVGLSQSNKSIP